MELAQHYTQLLQLALINLTYGQALGAWRTAVYLAGDPLSYYRLAGVWRGIFSGEESLPEPVRVWDSEDVAKLAVKRDEIAAKMPDIANYNKRQGLTSTQLMALERGFGVTVSEDARNGRVSEALVWHIAAWQTQQQAAGIDTGGVDGMIGPKTRAVLEKMGLLKQGERPE